MSQSPYTKPVGYLFGSAVAGAYCRNTGRGRDTVTFVRFWCGCERSELLTLGNFVEGTFHRCARHRE